MYTKKSEIWVGIFLLLALCAAIFLCLRVADVKSLGNEPTWRLYANFDNIGGLKTGSPVKVGGVVIGRVTDISLDAKTYLPRVTMAIEDKYNQLPDTSSLAVRTQGLLGEQFLALNVGFSDPDMGTAMLKDGSTIQDTKSALVLEDLIGQFLYKSNDESNKKGQQPAQGTTPPELSAPTQPK
ncbi:outer membrane lipid asymmetry maintenance protein MlaD [Erwinia sp. OLTSP20]|uniref:outer membrane lipid asymmetry maintenance protein MlaD n=1 Tax=unclassified Erwinia TaxID=2622719 RepID=UPI000C180A4F|nr:MULTISPECIES: outer membrane lipid asymmetry maintenance protein MlaD [unclassified Erwinia]PIJ51042.1 outer membrane lipid asymmetry maintenance protein MlaD [Erwinia sp. OAMSP11]PIJ73690.1 outer membrane lipid asymmetry maintenance protein MlaD [Erwinia sp. OLSSP12]PIJ83047.1 outer membrane lipid asymmetry maintenance protein MlaD [Erwinia sp. OLCASP19]PIJ85646.1 outer membrane lipid asymmetry maintenance protein MlaD [Erwinia sp. OLMTSP26]PIJ87705.1 outer membrane lipid asymmetry mainten